MTIVSTCVCPLQGRKKGLTALHTYIILHIHTLFVIAGYVKSNQILMWNVNGGRMAFFCLRSFVVSSGIPAFAGTKN